MKTNNLYACTRQKKHGIEAFRTDLPIFTKTVSVVEGVLWEIIFYMTNDKKSEYYVRLVIFFKATNTKSIKSRV